MAGWGQSLKPSARITARAELDRKSACLADAVSLHRHTPSTSNAEKMYAALDDYLEARRQVLYG